MKREKRKTRKNTKEREKGLSNRREKISVEETFPNIARWVSEFGWIEIGQDDYSRSFMRALDQGGMAWEGKAEYKSFDHALCALENALAKQIEETTT